MLKFLVKVFISLYLLNLLIDQVDTLHVGRYWSEVLCCTIMTHLGDLVFKVTDFEILCSSFCLKCFELYIAEADGWMLLDIILNFYAVAS